MYIYIRTDILIAHELAISQESAKLYCYPVDGCEVLETDLTSHFSQGRENAGECLLNVVESALRANEALRDLVMNCESVRCRS